MIDALRISIRRDITYENVKIALPSEFESLGLYPVFGDYTVMFKHNNKWHSSHSWTLALVHLSKGKLSLPGLPFNKIIIDDDKIYGPGQFIPHQILHAYNIPDFCHGPDVQVAFTVSTGIYLTTDYSISNIIWEHGIENHMMNIAEHPNLNPMEIVGLGVQEANDLSALKQHYKCGHVRSCRSTVI